MWQNPLLPPHLVFQALLLGSAVLAVILRNAVPGNRFNAFAGYDENLVLWSLGILSVIHLLMVWGEVSLTHQPAHARLAIWEMVQGRYKNDFRTGTILSL